MQCFAEMSLSLKASQVQEQVSSVQGERELESVSPVALNGRSTSALVQGVFFTGPPPKSFKYRKDDLG